MGIDGVGDVAYRQLRELSKSTSTPGVLFDYQGRGGPAKEPAGRSPFSNPGNERSGDLAGEVPKGICQDRGDERGTSWALP